MKLKNIFTNKKFFFFFFFLNLLFLTIILLFLEYINYIIFNLTEANISLKKNNTVLRNELISWNINIENKKTYIDLFCKYFLNKIQSINLDYKVYNIQGNIFNNINKN